ncbi:MAG: T9SS type A sorting domain-containing protein [Legionellales bacterium]
MKKLALTFVLLVPLLGIAQSYTPLVNPLGSSWSGFDFDIPNSVSWPINIQTGSDTIAGGLKYTAMNSNGGTYYYIREDSSGKVFVKRLLSDSIDYLLYDFSMQVGDSIYDSATGYFMKVTYIDSFQTPMGNMKRLYMQGSWHHATWIEGIGGYQLLNPFMFFQFEAAYCLESMRNGYQQMYLDTNCKLYPNAVSNIFSEKVHIYPVPAGDIINIDMGDAENSIRDEVNIIIENVNGQCIISQSIPVKTGTQISINLDKVPEGVYMACLVDSTGSKNLIGKFIVMK